MKTNLLTLVALLGGVFALPPQKKRSSNGPVIPVNFQDPSVIQVDNTFYAYSGPNGNPNANVQVARSPDFSTWSVLSGVDLLPDAGSWAAATPHVWSPDVNLVKSGEYVLYYSAAAASNPGKHCTGAATSSTPDGVFTPLESPLFCPIEAGGAIDPDGFIDPRTSKQYVVYKVDGNSNGHGGACSNTVAPIQPTPILLHEVSPFDGVTLIGKPVQLLTNTAADGPNIEAPALAFDSSSQTYILFFNSGCYTTTGYNIQYATSNSVLGPYTRRGKFLATGDTAAKVIIPGGIDVLPSDNTKAVFHADINQGYLQGDGSKRVRAVYAIDLKLSGHTASAGPLV
ncbi:hypothetical protein DV736_g3233, partial [Chaetothyriales sp. CBS 134916]